MDLECCLPVWDRLTADQQRSLSTAATEKSVKKGTVLHSGGQECTGLLVVRSGQLRAYILSDEGREITIYRLVEMDVCLFSASCMLRNIQFDVTVEAEKDSLLWVVPTDAYRAVMERSAPLANYTNELMSGRFSEVMWLMEQVMWRSFDQRLADFLLQESALEGTSALSITHERIAGHLGSAREVVTRMLRYFQSEGMVKLARGSVELTDVKRLSALCAPKKPARHRQ